MRMIPSSARNWIAVNAVQQASLKNKNMTTLSLRNLVNHAPLRRGVLLIALTLACFAFRQRRERFSQHRTGAIPAPTRLKGRMRFSVSRPVSTTRQLVIGRSITTPPATATRPTVLMRSVATQKARETRLTVLQRSMPTPPAPITPPPVLLHCASTQLAAKTQPPEWVRSLATQRAPGTRPPVPMRSATTMPTITQPSVLKRS